MAGFQVVVSQDSTTVVTMRTDSLGLAVIDLPEGAYTVDIVDREGLLPASGPTFISVTNGFYGLVDLFSIQSPVGQPTAGSFAVIARPFPLTGDGFLQPGGLAGFGFAVGTPSGQIVATLASDGSGVARTTLESGTYNVSLTSPTGAIHEGPKSVTVQQGRHTSLDWEFSLPPAGVATSGIVVQAVAPGLRPTVYGFPALAGYEFTAKPLADGPEVSVRTDARGVAILSVPAGEYRLDVTDTGARSRAEFSPEAPETIVVRESAYQLSTWSIPERSQPSDDQTFRPDFRRGIAIFDADAVEQPFIAIPVPFAEDRLIPIEQFVGLGLIEIDILNQGSTNRLPPLPTGITPVPFFILRDLPDD